MPFISFLRKGVYPAMSKTTNLTSGPMMRQMFWLCIPLLIGNILQQFYNIINSLIVTRYIGGGAFAALGVAETVMNLFIYCISGTCTGASVLVARCYGEGDHAKLRRQIYVSFMLIGGATLAAVVIGQLFLPLLLNIIHTLPCHFRHGFKQSSNFRHEINF